MQAVPYQILEVLENPSGHPEPTWIQRIMRFWQPDDLYHYTVYFACDKIREGGLPYGPFPLACCVVLMSGECLYLTECTFKDGKAVYKGQTLEPIERTSWPAIGLAVVTVSMHKELTDWKRDELA